MRKLIAMILVGMLILTAGCAKTEDLTPQLQALQEENEALRSQVAALQQQIEELQAGSVADWSLSGTPLLQGSGAEVTLTVVPTRYREGQMVSFRIALDGQNVADLYCDWDGSAYTATVELDAADGYSYSMLMTEPNGTQDYRELNSPANPVDPALVYMYSSMNASCTLTVTDWEINQEGLCVTDGNVDVQMPVMTLNGEAVTCSAISLVLQLDGQELSRKSVMIPQAQNNTIGFPLTATAFEIPELEEGNQLDLWLEVTLSDGQFLTHSGSSWFVFEGELIQAVG